MADSKISPTFDHTLNLSSVEQVNFRGQEAWGRWLLGHRAKLVLAAPKDQPGELGFNLSLPYEGQWAELVLNGQVIFRGSRLTKSASEFRSQLLIELKRGSNTLEILTNRSNLDGLGKPFAKNDNTDISVGLGQLDFKSVQVRPNILYGPQPSNFVGSAYSSASSLGLEKLTEQSGSLTVEYRLLRRFEHQGFTFSLDGKSVYELPTGTPGNLLVGRFNLPATPPGKNGVHVLKVNSRPVAPPAQAFLTTAQDDPNVQFYVQKLEIRPTTPNLQTNGWAAGILTLMLGSLLCLLFFRPRRT
ncbi:hypothetical protein [Deinococcus alpinitundrae]|uniref:hypothetical protein n=1 Tax=Deinococcus alpinitundrae TaxID=468913 RepID=UPI0013797E31|nr:hypothetical protein [Deinococcus alpinitundrae]